MKKLLLIITFSIVFVISLTGCNNNTVDNIMSEKNKTVIVQHEPENTPTASYTEKSETWTENWMIDEVEQTNFTVCRKDETLTIPNYAVENTNSIKPGRIIALWFNVDTKELVATKIFE